MSLTIYYYIIYIHCIVSGLTLAEAYNEHILSIHSAYIEHTLQSRGRLDESAMKGRRSQNSCRTVAE